ncbi:hypothetical protein AB0958_06825 [Streptomyces sp. NPDC006655]|uniref:hypothetical protein n=1 Tax=Streptomyces sp. NPDC006655 TaxID=3156898 RepID=UPI0034546B66
MFTPRGVEHQDALPPVRRRGPGRGAHLRKKAATADHDLVLVTGADGIGRLATERLRAQNVPVRVLIRREDDRAAEVRT